MAPAVMAALIGIAAVALLNPMVAATETHYSAAVARIESGASTVSLGEDAVWLRQGMGDDGGQMMIRAARTSPDVVTLLNEQGIRTHTRKADHYSGNVLDPLGLPDCIRISMCHYNTEGEVRALLGVIRSLGGDGV